MMWLLMGAALIAVAGGFWLDWLRRQHLVITVQGPSMAPTYTHGEVVLVRRRPGAQLRTGDVAVVDLPDEVRPIPAGVSAAEALLNRRVIKRVAATAGDPTPPAVKAFGDPVPQGRLVLLGDNPLGSGDSRLYGFVPADAVVGVVVRRLRTKPKPATDTTATPDRSR